MDNAVRIEMWSGPRNISTAMLRSFENRTDCAVIDEPFYGPYLHATGKPHPGAEDVIAEQGSDWDAVKHQVTGPVPGDKPVYYHKQMAHHILPDMDLSWMNSLHNCFLIRDPGEVVASFTQQIEDITAEDLGFPQQQWLFDHLVEVTGKVPLVLESRDILKDPGGMLGALCDSVGIEFSDRMLQWPKGSRDTDGVWAKYWYKAVQQSTGFAPYRSREFTLSAAHQRIADECMPTYEMLYQHRLVL
ncbi:MAG: hypothetical protein ACI8P9_003059 [Parasphingorhabdus sp.]|jgi:hypothetical protein